ncbi:BACON domain-containing protein [Streptomyces sp. NPDC054861]
MTSSRLEPPTHTTGAHRAHRRAPSHAAGSAPTGAPSGTKAAQAAKAGAGADARAGSRTHGRRSPSRDEPVHEPCLDGLFTYCLSVLCDHDTATAVLGDVLALAERHRGRCPSDEEGRRAWLYALARWACLRTLGEQRRKRQGGAHSGRQAAGKGDAERARDADGSADETPGAASGTDAHRRRAELSLLAWPEAAGTTPEQREALELAVRHGLGHRGVAAVLSLDPLAARELLSSAACEVERTRAALAVVETGGCPAVARLTGDHQVLLSAALRAELVRHVDDCPRCRRAAERAGAGGPWPGAAADAPARLPLVPAPPPAACAAAGIPRARAGAPRFGPTGFPMDPKDHAARRDRMRARAVTTTVVAAVVAAPVLALWASYRGDPSTGEGRAGAPVTARESEDAGGLDGAPNDRYENTGNARTTPDPRFTQGSRSPDVSVEVISPGGPTGPTLPGQPAAGRITVSAHGNGATTTLTLTNSGGSSVDWSLWTDGPWLYVSQASGTLRPGQSVTVRVHVDQAREPSGAWSARVGVNPSGAVVRIHGRGATTPPPTTEEPPPTTDPTTPPPTTDPTTPPPTTEEPPPTTDPTDPTSPPPTTEEPPPTTGEPTPSTDPGTPGDTGSPPPS